MIFATSQGSLFHPVSYDDPWKISISSTHLLLHKFIEQVSWGHERHFHHLGVKATALILFTATHANKTIREINSWFLNLDRAVEEITKSASKNKEALAYLEEFSTYPRHSQYEAINLADTIMRYHILQNKGIYTKARCAIEDFIIKSGV